MNFSFKKALAVLFLILLILLGFWFFKKDGSDESIISGWEQVRVSVETRYASNPELKKAALQMAKALQLAVQNPDNAVAIDVELEKAMSCVLGVLEKQGSDESGVLGDIRDLAIKGSERERRYIRYNARLSGRVFDGGGPDISLCTQD
ncbi:hypothetical protein [Bdellovibrio bacteriovorus]|uniref:hypothetical protein n=1 Tax=Bdellovibrio bacteriovorus TaxID=959 RepID=UPI0035A577D6